MGLGQSRDRQAAASRAGGSGQAAAGRKPAPPPKKAWTEEQVQRLISDKKLAPRLALTTQIGVDRETECPICFNDFEHLNSVACCNQFICTDCYVKIRMPGDVCCVCPFCDAQGFPVVPIDNAAPSATPSTAASPASAVTQNPLGGGGDSDSATTPSSSTAAVSPASPPSSQASNRRKTPSTPIHIPLSTKADRESIEKEIQMSRSADTYDDGFGRVGGSFAARASRSSSEFSAQSRAAAIRRASSSSSRGSPRGSATAASPDEEAFREIQRMLQGSTLADVNEIMLLAAIRQSMQEQTHSDSAGAGAGAGAGAEGGAAGAGAAGAAGPASPVRTALTAAAAAAAAVPIPGSVSTLPISPPPAPTSPAHATPERQNWQPRTRGGSSISEMSEMTEDEQLQLAISLSLTPTAADTNPSRP